MICLIFALKQALDNYFQQRPEHFLGLSHLSPKRSTSSELLHQLRNTTPALFCSLYPGVYLLLITQFHRDFCRSVNCSSHSFRTTSIAFSLADPKPGLQGFKLAAIPARHCHATRDSLKVAIFSEQTALVGVLLFSMRRPRSPQLDANSSPHFLRSRLPSCTRPL